MKLKTQYYEAHRSSRSFTTVTRSGGQVHIQEWDLVTLTRAEMVLETETSLARYAAMIAAHGGNEEDVRREVVDEARRHIEQPLGSRLAHRALRLILPPAA